MPTVDLISPAAAFTPAAVGNTQDLTTTFSITSGTPTLTCNGASPFVSGDTGKSFSLSKGGAAGPTNTWLGGTLTFVSSSVVTLSVNASSNLSSTTARLIWGSDDAPAFQAFNTWAQAQTSPITLTLGSGAKTFFVASADSNAIRANSLAFGVTQSLTVIGNGNTTTKMLGSVSAGLTFGDANWLKSGNGNFGSTNSWTARLQNVTVGSTVLTCKTASDTSQFSTNTWALLAGIDMQAGGQPVNPFYFEYVFITGINGGAGTVTIQSPVVNAYLSTWPFFNGGTPGMQPDQGGPATLYAIDPNWNINVIYQNFGIDNSASGQTNASGFNVQWVGAKVYDASGLIPSGNKFTSYTGCDLTAYSMEVDKDCAQIVFDSSSTGQLSFQSSNNQVTVRNGCTIASFSGTPRFLEIDNSTVNGLGLGTLGFGRTDSFVTVNSTLTTSFGYFGVVDSGDITGNGIQVDYTMSGGVIKIPKAGKSYGCRWMIPGTKCFFGGQFPGPSFFNVAWGPMFTVLSVIDDSSFVYVTTDWSSGGFPFWSKTINVVPSSSINFASNTVSSVDAVNSLVVASAAGYYTPGTYRFANLNGGNLGNTSSSIMLPPTTGGRLVSFTVNITTPYTGVNAPLVWMPVFSNGAILTNAGFNLLSYNPVFDLRTTGKRVILPTGVSGAVGIDSALMPGDSKAWFSDFLSGMGASQNITAEYTGNPAVGPVFTVELILSQVGSVGATPDVLGLAASEC